MSDRTISAVFDSREEAERALSELRSAGINDDSISIVGRHESGDGSGLVDNDSDSDDDAKGDVLKGAAIGTGAGALLGIAALAIPGVGPLAAAGAIAASAIPEGAAIGAGAGMAAGGISGLLAKHGVDDENAKYYEEHLGRGGYFVSVQADDDDVPAQTAQEIMFRNGGHNTSRARTAAV